MPDREKLIALVKRAITDWEHGDVSEKIADHLLANGATIQRWIPVEERLPERTMPPHDVLVYHDLKCGMFVDRAWYSYDLNRWCSVLGMKLKVTHWMPLPQTPIEEQNRARGGENDGVLV